MRPILVVTDARRRELAWSSYGLPDADGLPVRLAGPSLILAAELGEAGPPAAGLEGDFDRIDVAPQLIACLGKTHEIAIERFQRSQMYSHLSSLRASTLKGQVGFAFEHLNLVGTADEIVARVSRLAEAGVKHLAAIMFCADTVDGMLEQMQEFAEDVMPLV